jgi:mono/diheme cytochrome c family protein
VRSCLAMRRAVQFCVGAALFANVLAIILAPLAPSRAKDDEVLSPAAQRGLVIVRTNCSRCHAVGKMGRQAARRLDFRRMAGRPVWRRAATSLASCETGRSYCTLAFRQAVSVLSLS